VTTGQATFRSLHTHTHTHTPDARQPVDTRQQCRSPEWAALDDHPRMKVLGIITDTWHRKPSVAGTTRAPHTPVTSTSKFNNENGTQQSAYLRRGRSCRKIVAMKQTPGETHLHMRSLAVPAPNHNSTPPGP